MMLWTTLSSGSLGLWVDEERSQLRELMWIAGHLEHRHLERTLRPQVLLRPCLAEGRLYTSSNLHYCCVDGSCSKFCISTSLSNVLYLFWITRNSLQCFKTIFFEAFAIVVCVFKTKTIMQKSVGSKAYFEAQLDGLLLSKLPVAGCLRKMFLFLQNFLIPTSD